MIVLTAGHTGPNSGAQCAETHFDEGAENIWLRNRIAEILTNKYGLVVLVDEDRASLQLLVKELKSPTDCTDDTDIIHPFPSDSLSCYARSTPIGRDSCFALHSPSELDSASLNARSRSTDDTDFDAVAAPACHAVLKPHTENMSLTEDGLQSTDLTPPPYRHLPYKQGRNHESAQHLKILPLFIGGVPEGGGGSTINDFVIDIHFNAHSNPQARGTETIVADDATSLELRFATRLAHVTADALDIPLRSIKSE